MRMKKTLLGDVNLLNESWLPQNDKSSARKLSSI